MKTIYKTLEAQQQIINYYDQMIVKMNLAFKSKLIKTRFGNTHILCSEKKHASPLIILHGGSTLNPIELRHFQQLSKDYCIYAPDLIGEPGKSASNRLSTKNEEYAQWVIDVLDELGIPLANFIGTSVGGGILLKLAVFAPNRIKKAVFIVPMGIMKPNIKIMLDVIIKLGLPAIYYRSYPSDEKLIQALKPFFRRISDIDEEYLGSQKLIYQYTPLMRSEFIPPDKEELKLFTAPSMIIASENDVFVPARYLIPKAKEIIPNLNKIIIVNEGTHCLSKNDMEKLITDIDHFLIDKTS